MKFKNSTNRINKTKTISTKIQTILSFKVMLLFVDFTFLYSFKTFFRLFVLIIAVFQILIFYKN